MGSVAVGFLHASYSYKVNDGFRFVITKTLRYSCPDGRSFFIDEASVELNDVINKFFGCKFIREVV
jgi:hypothetical protein